MRTSRRSAVGQSDARRVVSRSISRRGSATLDYVLVLGAIFPIAGVSIYLGSRIIKLVYEMTCVLVSWPFM